MVQVESAKTGNGVAARAGEQVLTLLATPLNFMILRALADRPLRLAELRRATGLPAQTTLRGHLAGLEALGVVGKRPTERTPYAVENALTAMGRDLLAVAVQLECWLARAPERPISLETGSARGVVKALVDGWGSTMLGRLAASPLSLTQLDRQIVALSYPALERRLSSLRMAGLVEALPTGPKGTPYAVTPWARMAVVPVFAASRCERKHLLGRPAPLTAVDVEAAFMLATPLALLDEKASGACQLRVEEDGAPDPSVAVQVTVDGGRVVACTVDLLAPDCAFAAGSEESWLCAIGQNTASKLRFGGGRLGKGLVAAMHSALTLR